MKTAITVFVLLLVGVGVTGGIYAWKKLNSLDPRGVQLELQADIAEEQREEILASYNDLLDLDSILRPVVQQHDLQKYYEVTSEDEAVALIRKNSYVQYPPLNKRAIYILMNGKRMDRKYVEKVSRDIAKGFLGEIERRRESVSGGL